MQFSTAVKLALVAAHVGVAMATPTTFRSRQLDIFCTSNADCSTGDECVDLLGSLGLPGVLEVCLPDGLDLGDLAKAGNA
ncbi:hypothetical protein NUW54_g6870 [Trametes sanguinea]|uniref:Uncharacterized protein n=1 Tax=Trametes sanguinea TaxID=158606 RepID=A0ACC1PR02_9APHY|nr:hypothetical protein NUW54_g6870 [Trametes sanguinea]